MRIGVIAIQGNVEEHVSAVMKASPHAEVVKIKHKGIVPTCDALIIPGGESTNIGRLMEREGISSEIKKVASAGIPIMGTGGGLVLLSKQGDEQVEKTKKLL